MANRGRSTAMVPAGARGTKGKNVVGTCGVTTGAKTKSGRNVKSGTVVQYSDGSTQTLLTPAGKGEKYASEMRDNVRYTNNGDIKQGYLTAQERAYRGGYLDAQKDARKAYNAKNKNRR